MSAASAPRAILRVQLARNRRTDLFFAVAEHANFREVRQSRIATTACAAYMPASKPDFMSQTPGPMRRVTAAMKRELAGGAIGIDGIGMPDHDEARLAFAAPARVQHVAVLFLRQIDYLCAEITESLAHVARHGVHAGLVVGAAVDIDQRFQIAQVVGQIG